MTHLKVGDKAPDFRTTNENGDEITLSDYAGKKLVIFFYPADDTPTCTKEACNLRDGYAELGKHGIDVLGVSPDNEKKHSKFINKYDLPYSLAVDTSLEILKAYGVWGLKKFMGREFDGVHRTTFIIDEKGMISGIIEKVKSADHTNQILAELGIS